MADHVPFKVLVAIDSDVLDLKGEYSITSNAVCRRAILAANREAGSELHLVTVVGSSLAPLKENEATIAHAGDNLLKLAQDEVAAFTKTTPVQSPRSWRTSSAARPATRSSGWRRGSARTSSWWARTDERASRASCSARSPSTSFDAPAARSSSSAPRSTRRPGSRPDRAPVRAMRGGAGGERRQRDLVRATQRAPRARAHLLGRRQHGARAHGALGLLGLMRSPAPPAKTAKTQPMEMK